jgi:hypothetical protein
MNSCYLKKMKLKNPINLYKEKIYIGHLDIPKDRNKILKNNALMDIDISL